MSRTSGVGVGGAPPRHIGLESMRHRTRRLVQTPATFRNWPTLLWGLAAGPRAADTLTFLTRGGLRITCPNVAGARVPIYEVFAEDCYRLDDFLGPMLDEPITVVDIGAHIGAFACALATKAPRATVRCYEPSPTTTAFLRGNIEANGFTDRVGVHEAAVAAIAGELLLIDNGGASALNRVVRADSGGFGLTVQATTFDLVLEDLGQADVVKIDCEGGEYDLVFASNPDNWSSVRRLVLEYHPHPAHTWPQLREWFAARGLHVASDAAQSDSQGTAWLRRGD